MKRVRCIAEESVKSSKIRNHTVMIFGSRVPQWRGPGVGSEWGGYHHVILPLSQA